MPTAAVRSYVAVGCDDVTIVIMSIEMWRRVGAIGGGALAGLALGAALGQLLNWRFQILFDEYRFRGNSVDSISTGGLTLAGLGAGLGMGLVIAALIRNRPQ